MEGRAGRIDQALDFLLAEDLWQAMVLFRIGVSVVLQARLSVLQ